MAKDIKEFAHHEFLEYLPDYELIRDCYEGSREIKSENIKYLPKLKGQSDEDYANYLYRALFFPITGKTCTTMIGLATARPPKVTYPEEMRSYFVDTEYGYQFTEFYVGTMMEVTLMGRYGILIDAPIEGAPMPKLFRYEAENIVRWELDDNGKLIDLLLEECVTAKTDKKFETKEVKRYRHCFLLNEQYWVEVLNDDLDVIMGPIQPIFSGFAIDYIPFVCIGSTGAHFEIDRAPMLDIATINISHYLTSADLEWGRHIVGLPTPVVSGVDSSTKLMIGGTAAWILPNEAAKAYYLEFQGQGLQSLEKAMAEKINLMASVSARMVDTSTRGSEAPETVKLRYMSESATIIHIIGAVETGLMIAYNMIAKLMRLTEPVSVKFSREIVGSGMTYKDLVALFEVYFKGGVDDQTMLFNLRKADAVDPNRTDGEVLAALAELKQPQSAAAGTQGA